MNAHTITEFIHLSIHPFKLLGNGGFMPGTEADTETDEESQVLSSKILSSIAVIVKLNVLSNMPTARTTRGFLLLS